MIKECKKCGSKNLYLEPRIKGQDVMTANMVALKCKDCGFWLKWCPKDERKFYLKQPKDKWKMLKEWLEETINSMSDNANYRQKEELKFVIQKMRELEGEDE